MHNDDDSELSARDIEAGKRTVNPLQTTQSDPRVSTSSSVYAYEDEDIIDGFGDDFEIEVNNADNAKEFDQDNDILIGRKSMHEHTEGNHADNLTNRSSLIQRRKKRTMTSKMMIQIKKAEMEVKKIVNVTKMNNYRRFLVVFLFVPMVFIHLVLQVRLFIVLGVYNYSGVNLRSFSVSRIMTEREILRRRNRFRADGLSLNKVNYIAERYKDYWIIVILFIVTTPFINSINADSIQAVLDSGPFEDNPTVKYLIQVALSFLIGFANLIPKKAVRPDVSSFLSSFLDLDMTIRDSIHTRLKDLTEILNDIKKWKFALFHTEIGSPVIVTTQEPEELTKMHEFIELLYTDTFDNNQILRFIQIEADVDSFYVLRNDVAMCLLTETEQMNWSDLWSETTQFKIRLDISDFELSLYGGASLVLLVGLFAAPFKLPVEVILGFWATWPVFYAVFFRRRKSRLASMNFFTLDGKDRKYQPFNNVVVKTDDFIWNKINDFAFFQALFKFTRQPEYLIHSLLKCTETLRYEWLDKGIKVKDFKRLLATVVNIYEKDIGYISPTARIYFRAPRQKSNGSCVVFILNEECKIRSQLMTYDIFQRVSSHLTSGKDKVSFENTFLS